MAELQEVIHRVYPGGGFTIRRTREPLEGLCCCVHCKGSGTETKTVAWQRVSWSMLPVQWVQDFPCCVCGGVGWFRPANGEPPPACH
jgi:hypothetical protein